MIPGPGPGQVRTLRILGTRGVPAAHGGFETFAERLALHLVERGCRVTVYCQLDGRGPVTEDTWCGLRRVNIPVGVAGPAGTVLFDWLATRHAAAHREPCLTLGYNTAVFSVLLRAARVPNVINMDGIEWQRDKWGALAKTWFWLNEHAGAWLGNHLIADHPEIARHLRRLVPESKLTTISYGSDRLQDEPTGPLHALGLEPGGYATLIARPEPENSVLEVVQAWSRRRRNLVLAVLGTYRDDHAYQRAVKAAAGPEVRFLGAIYDRTQVHALRAHSAFYVHGHRVGGTNPSLVEALGAGNAVVSHDNPFNRWVAADAARYFRGADDLAQLLDQLLADPDALAQMRQGALQRHAQAFTWSEVLDTYVRMLEQQVWGAIPVVGG